MTESTPPRKRGRPSTYVAKVAEAVCERMAAGEPLRVICQDEGMPPESTVRQWALDDVDGFAARYARARELQADAIAESITEIADDGRNDWMERHSDRGPGWELNGEHVQRSRLRVESRKWLLSKMLPKRYGDRTEVEHSGSMKVDLVTTLSMLPKVEPPDDV